VAVAQPQQVSMELAAQLHQGKEMQGRQEAQTTLLIV
jgi:hypothetical protein